MHPVSFLRPYNAMLINYQGLLPLLKSETIVPIWISVSNILLKSSSIYTNIPPSYNRVQGT